MTQWRKAVALSSRNPVASKARKAARNGAPARRSSGDNWLDAFIPYRLYRATAKLNGKLLTRLRSLRINPSRWRVLSVLKAYGALSIGEIAQATLTEQPTVSRVVAQLEKEGRVLRRSSARDSRVVQISLTQQGIDAFNQIATTALKHEELAFRDISRKEIALLLAILDQIEDNMQASE
jgi:DNA-binding MarR family transcriptional regulator